MSDAQIAIVGAGPRALNLIERLAWVLRVEPGHGPVTVHLIDPGEPCAGAHPAGQSRHLLTNTLACQVTMFSPREPGDALSGASGPSFTEWARDAGYRRFGAEYRRAKEGGAEEGGAEIGDLDYLPRAMLGEYLAFAYRRVVAGAPAGLRVVHHRAEAVDVEQGPLCVRLADGGRVRCEAVVLATGHCEGQPSAVDLERQGFVEAHRGSNARLGYVRGVYPASRLDGIADGAVVAVQGLGLTAYDVIAALTQGRGGRFEGDGAALRYRASGREPRLLLFSRQSLPYDGRAVNQKGVDGGHRARFLTAGAVAEIRARRMAATGDGRLDFEADIMPLLRRDMAFAYRSAATGMEPEVAGFVPSAEEEAVLDGVMAPQLLVGCSGLGEVLRRVVASLEADLAEARRGNVSSARKAATDAVRDLRAGLCAAIEHGGLLPDSHRFVCERFVPMTNRVTFGPPLRRNAELLALIGAGIVGWAGGAGATVRAVPERSRFVVRTPYAGRVGETEADVLVVARVPGHRPAEDARPLSRALVARGLARPFRNGEYHPHGMDVDRRMRVIGAGGGWAEGLWAIGFVTEGARFHTHALPRPGRASTQLQDAAGLVDDLLAVLADRRRRAAAVGAGSRLVTA